MKYVELLSRIDPGTSAYIGMMQNDKSKSADDRKAEKVGKDNRCITCRGKKRIKIKRVTTGDSQTKYEPCPRCLGSGKKPETSNKETRHRGVPEIMSVEQIAFCTAGIDKHRLRAAYIFATRSGYLRRPLERDIKRELIDPISSSWTLSPDAVKIRALGLSRVISARMMIADRVDFMATDMASDLMCCSHQDWDRTWGPKAKDLHEKVMGWVVSVDNQMREASTEVQAA